MKSIKYVLKYMNKGCDHAVYTIQPSRNRMQMRSASSSRHALWAAAKLHGASGTSLYMSDSLLLFH